MLSSGTSNESASCWRNMATRHRALPDFDCHGALPALREISAGGRQRLRRAGTSSVRLKRSVLPNRRYDTASVATILRSVRVDTPRPAPSSGETINLNCLFSSVISFTTDSRVNVTVAVRWADAELLSTKSSHQPTRRRRRTSRRRGQRRRSARRTCAGGQRHASPRGGQLERQLLASLHTRRRLGPRSRSIVAASSRGPAAAALQP